MAQNNELQLDPHKFAELVINSHQVSDDLDPEAIVKRKLTLYLTAYYLAERFDQLETQEFGSGYNGDKEKYQALLAQMANEKFGDW
jgi:hypothetical protein